MLPQEYKGSAVNIRFWYLEFTKIMTYKGAGFTDSEIKKLQDEENFVLSPSKSYGKKIVNTTLKRMEKLPQDLLLIYLSQDTLTQKLIVLVSIMLSDRFFYDFVYDVYRPSIKNEDSVLSVKKEILFIEQKNRESDKVANFTEQTKKRIVSSYKNYFREAHLLRKSGNKEYFVKTFIDDNIKVKLVENNMEFILKALADERLA